MILVVGWGQANDIDFDSDKYQKLSSHEKIDKLWNFIDSPKMTGTQYLSQKHKSCAFENLYKAQHRLSEFKNAFKMKGDVK